MAIVPAFFSRLGVTFLASKSRDARLYGQFLRAFGGRLAIGSRAEDGPAGVMNAIRTIQSGRPVALSPDGPKGPRHHLKPGESKAGPFKEYEKLDPSLLGRATYLMGLWFLWLMRLGMLTAWLREALKLL